MVDKLIILACKSTDRKKTIVFFLETYCQRIGIKKYQKYLSKYYLQGKGRKSGSVSIKGPRGVS
jgi:hypothetical protein